MTDILSEINEEVRREKALAFWKKNAPLMVGAAIVALVATAGYTLWRGSNEQALTKATTSIVESLQGLTATTRPTTIAALEKAAAEDGKKLAWMAQFYAAGLLTDEGKSADAALKYDVIVADATTPALYRDLARLLAAENRLNLPDAKVDEIKAVLTPLATPDAPWRNAARELLGAIQLRANDTAGAKQWFEAIQADPETPPSQRTRMVQILASLK